MSIRRLAVSALLAGFGLPALAAPDAAPAAQREQQKKVAAEVEQTVRRIKTTLRVLNYQKVAVKAGSRDHQETEQKILEGIAADLKQLNDGQLQAVLKHLDNALAAPDAATATAEQREAYQQHRAAMAALRDMVYKLDILKSLDQAAARIDKLAKDEHAMHLRAIQTENFKSVQVRGQRGLPGGSRDDREEQADSQGDLGNELVSIVKQLAVLKPSLTPEQKERLDKSDAAAKGGQLIADMTIASKDLTAGQFNGAAERQLRVSKELQALALALRTPRDKVTAMKEARDKIEKTIQAEQALKAETEIAKKPEEQKRPPDRFERYAPDPKKVETQRLADQQAKLEFETREVRKALEDVAKEAAAKLTPAESEMKRAQDELRQNADPDKAVPAEENSIDRLKEAREELDKQIAQAEKEKSDALAATKKAAEQVEKLIQEQKKVQADTKAEKKADELKKVADAQKDISKKADELKNLPLPDKTEAKQALDKAADEAKKAADDLAAKDKAAAQPKQDETLKALEAAKKALEDKAKEIEKRREDLAKIEAAQKKLDELSKQEKKVAEEAKANTDANKDKSDQLAKKQDEVTPPTKDVAKDVKDVAPDAAQKLDQSAAKQQEAKDNLQKNMPTPAAEKGTEAAKKLDEARDALDKKADELKAKEIADQAALQPNQVNPMDAAQQLAKAIEQANKAAEQANKAADQLQKPMDSQAKNLAEQQKKIAEQAQKQNQPEAAKNADAAAKALEQGDIPKAVQEQQAALDKLNDAAKGEPMPGEGQPMKGEGQPPNNAQLAKAQQQLKEATEALAQSAQANQAAQAALNQAQAVAPMAVQQQLNQAAQKLNQAGQQLGQGEPMNAGQSQQQAAQQLGEALQALNAANQAAGQQQSQPGQPMQAQGQPGQPGQQPGQPGQQPGQPGQQPGQPGQPGQQQPGQQPGKQPGNKEDNQNRGEGDRTSPDGMKNVAPNGKSQDGDGTFINLQKKERDKVQQNAEAGFPAEFREKLKQYNINIKNAGKPQAKTPPPAAKPDDKKP